MKADNMITFIKRKKLQRYIQIPNDNYVLPDLKSYYSQVFPTNNYDSDFLT
ncbi:MAG: hypothetical protein KAG99_09415 [Bacteroidales bacterium]|nr:hypothetical protein [Bacteroidales bacterium]